jgi:hypothetical protein
MEVQAAIWSLQVVEDFAMAMRADQEVPFDKLALVASQLQVLSLYLTGACATACEVAIKAFLDSGAELEFLCGDGESVLYVNADLAPDQPPVSFAGDSLDINNRWTELMEQWQKS